jgi:hypothetical protein
MKNAREDKNFKREEPRLGQGMKAAQFGWNGKLDITSLRYSACPLKLP